MCGWDSGNERKSRPTCMRPQRAQWDWDAVDDPLQESFAMFFHLDGHRSVQRKRRFQYFQCHFSTAVSWTYTLCPTSLCWNQPLLRGENRELILWMSEASQRASLVPAAVASPWSEGQPHPAGQWGKWGNDCSLFENVPLFKAVFLPWAHVPAGSFLQGLGCKMRPQGQAQKDCRVPRLFLWMAALTRRYNDSLCS